MSKIYFIILELAFFIAAAPFFSGLITKIKNNLRLRKGQGILQPYHNLAKLISKGEVVSDTASWIFRVTPFIVIASTLCAASLIPVFIFYAPMNYMGDFLTLIFIFALARFFLALAALDTGSSFGGMGSSREMFISSLVEPGLCLAIFAISLRSGSTSLAAFSAVHQVPVYFIIAGVALFLITLAETSRIPVDNQETHLELTMVHEAMVLEYSGKSLALIEMASYVKQMIFFFLIAQIIFPISSPAATNPVQIIFWALWYLTRIIIVAVTVAVVEVSIAKMRLFRVADFLGFAFVLGIIASICAILGV
ncbi:MAG: NADH-quinone oxidoreductase subunit H [Candidatus Omnitrophota bacterium]|jgi:formate hydrogenlyase subunit 4